MSLNDSIKTADFKSEKHVPVMDIVAKEGDMYTIGLKIGKEVPHPNTTEHFIAYVDLFFKSEDGKFIEHLGRADFTAHGASIEGANKGSAYTEPVAAFKVKITKPGKLTAVSYCNIHGLWESELAI